MTLTRTRRLLIGLAALGLAFAPAVAASATPRSLAAPLVRVSVANDGTQANDYSSAPALSASGRYVAFVSRASNLVADDTNGMLDVFVRDLHAGTTRRASVASDGTQANGSTPFEAGGGARAVSADGRYVAFASDATNLDPADTNAMTDVFVHDVRTGTTRRVSVASDGSQANAWPGWTAALSANGRYVAFTSNATSLGGDGTNNTIAVFVRDLWTGVTRRASVASDGTPANRPSGAWLALSANGRYVAFTSTATNLVADDTNDTEDVFVHDLQTGTTQRVSVANDGTQANSYPGSWPALSANGRYVAFDTTSNLVADDTNDTYDVFVRRLWP